MQCCWRECTFTSFRPHNSVWADTLVVNPRSRRHLPEMHGDDVGFAPDGPNNGSTSGDVVRLLRRTRDTPIQDHGTARSLEYIWFAHGDREQLFDMAKDPLEHSNLIESPRDVARKLKDAAAAACKRPELRAVVDGNGLRGFSFEARPLQRIYQFDHSRGITGFPKRSQEVLSHFRPPITSER